MGVLFTWDPITCTYTKKLDFNGTENGKYPFGSLMQADNGKLYGMTSAGGTDDQGVLFEWDTVLQTYTKRIDFNGTENGCKPHGSLMQSDNGKLYGMTSGGGVNNEGVLFEFDLETNICSKKIDFEDRERGSTPYGSLVQAGNGKLYGMTFCGGWYGFGAAHDISGIGVLFEYDPVSNMFTSKLDFWDDTGRHPYGSLVNASNGKLYGMTFNGGADNNGVLFEWDPSTNIYLKKMDFKNEGDYFQFGSLMKSKNDKIYGIYTGGGLNNCGVLFEWDPETTEYSEKLDFNGAENGSYYLYSPPLSIISTNYLLEIYNGKIFGMTPCGGSHGDGVLFEWEPTTNKYTKWLDFNGNENGSHPSGSLTLANNGKLYGLTQYGGSNNTGVLFEWDPVTDTFTKKHDFDGFDKGGYPVGSLVLADNGKLYGITTNRGVLFEWDPDNDIYTKILDFNPDGYKASPEGMLMKANNGKLYKILTENTIIEWDPETNTSRNINIGGVRPGLSGSLLQAKNGKFYWTTKYNDGKLREWNPRTNDWRTVIGFNSLTGRYPLGTLTEIDNPSCGYAEACDSFTSPSGKIWTTSGVYTDTIPGKSGYDSIIIINLTIYNSTAYTYNQVVCDSYTSPSGRYTWTTSGTYFDTVPNPVGCNSIITINLTVKNSSTSTISPTACESYTSPSGKYTWETSGTYSDTIPNSVGCDSIITIQLTINNNSQSTISPTTCESYTSPSGKYTWETSGTYSDTIPNSVGCDSIITIQLTINNNSQSTISPTACGSYTSPSGRYTWETSGTYTDTIPNSVGCDSIITIQLTINNNSQSTISPTACESYTSPSGKYTWETSGTYSDTIANSVGCDSIIAIELTINNNSQGTISPTACGSYTSPSGRYTWETSGTYSDTIANSVGCDSIIAIELTINNNSQVTISPTACGSYTSPSGRYTWETSGTYSDTISNSVGCDSIIAIELTINNNSQGTISPTACGSYTSPSGKYPGKPVGPIQIPFLMQQVVTVSLP